MRVKITKDGESQTILATLETAKELFPESDGNTHELLVDKNYNKITKSDGSIEETVTDVTSARLQKANKEMEGRQWRDDELSRTDPLVLLPDHPDKDKFVAYRQALRDWPSTGNFPDTRPTTG